MSVDRHHKEIEMWSRKKPKKILKDKELEKEVNVYRM
jgi:hypothetical protein